MIIFEKERNTRKMDQYIYDMGKQTDDEDGDARADAGATVRMNASAPDEEGEFFALE